MRVYKVNKWHPSVETNKMNIDLEKYHEANVIVYEAEKCGFQVMFDEEFVWIDDKGFRQR